MVSVLSLYRGMSRQYPLSTAFGTCFIKGSVSDVIAQRLSGEKEFDAKRTLAFAVFSGAYLGICQHYIYNVAFSRLFGSGQDFFTATKKVIADATVHVPFIYLPLHYPFETVATGEGSAFDGWQRYYDDAPKVLSTYWCVWPPAHFISFTVLPPELRISFIASLSFIWLVYLSSATHADRNHRGNKVFYFPRFETNPFEYYFQARSSAQQPHEKQSTAAD